MALLIAVAVVALALGAFLALTAVEAKSGARLFAPLRARLDVYVINVVHAVRNIDMNALAYAKVRALIIHLGHEAAHGALITIRALERFFTRIVRTLRHKKEGIAAPTDTASKIG